MDPQFSVIAISIGAPIVSALAALGGAHLSNRHAARQNIAARFMDSVSDDRNTIAQILSTGYAWVQIEEIMVVIFNRSNQNEFLAVTDTDMMKRLGDANEQLSVSFVAARLGMTNKDVQAKIKDLADFHKAFARDVNTPLLKNRNDDKEIERALRAVYRFESMLGELEQIAADYFLQTQKKHSTAK